MPTLFAQLYDKNWVIGGYYLKPSILTFDFDTMVVVVPDSIALAMDNPHDISDADGQLAFYTNGCHIANREHKIMLNGDTINPGKKHKNYCRWYTGYPLFDAKIALPIPEQPNKYVLFHQRLNDQKWFVEDLLLTTIDMTLDDGRGAVIEKNKLIQKDPTGMNNIMDAVRHGNGRDWWVITTSADTAGTIYFNKLTPIGVEPRITRQMEPPKPQGGNWGMTFSPDGAQFGVLGSLWNQYLTLANFDRCTAEFSNIRHIPYSKFGIPDSVMNSCGGLAFSPNSRYLYASMNFTKMYQIDTETDSVVLLGEFYYDSIAGSLPATFFAPKRGMDGKIYMGTTNTTKALHLVNNPDLPAPACDFEQYAIILHYSPRFLPHHPNYRLGARLDDPCDTSAVTHQAQLQIEPPSFLLFPNPIDREIGLHFSKSVEEPIVEIFDAMGRLVFEKKYPFTPIVSLHIVVDLPNGSYFVVVRSEQNGQFLGVRRATVARK